MLARVFFVALLSSSVCLAQSDWNQWRGPNRDSQVQDAQWPDSLSDLQLLWEQPHNPSYSGPIVSGSLVYTTETIGKKDEKVTAYDLSTGEEAWSAKWPGAMAVPFFAASNGDWIRSTPACDGHNLVVLGMRDVLVCLDPKTGDERWRVDFPQQKSTQLPAFGAVCSPLIDEDAVYIQTGGALEKLDISTGKSIWTALPNAEGMTSSGAFSSPTIATLAGKRQLVVATRPELCGVDLETGAVLWKTPIESFRGMNILTPLIVGDDRVFTAAHSGTSQLFKVSKTAGQWSVHELWSQKMQGYMSSPVLIDKTVYLHMKNQRVSALNADDGSINWTSAPQGKYWSMVAGGDKILALDNRGDLFLIKHDTGEMKVVDQSKVASDAWAHLAVQGDTLIVRDLEALKVYRW